MIPSGYYEYRPEGGDRYVVRLEKLTYANGRTAVMLYDLEGQQVACATVNIPEQTLNEGEVFVKTWGGNESMLNFLVKNLIVIDTGRDVPAGGMKARACKLLK